MLAYEKRPLYDELSRHQQKLQDEWDKLPPIYLDDGSINAKNYENLAGAMNHIAKCKKMLMSPLW